MNLSEPAMLHSPTPKALQPGHAHKSGRVRSGIAVIDGGVCDILGTAGVHGACCDPGDRWRVTGMGVCNPRRVLRTLIRR